MKRIAIVAMITAALALAAQQPSNPATPQPPIQQPATSNQQPGRFLGVATCANSGCHGSTEALNTTRVLQNEYFTWLNSDRHAGAYNVLFDPRSLRIAKNMRLKAKPHEATLCLDCHTTNVPVSLVEGVIDAEDGIQCEVCHGPASGWRAEHAEEGWTHEQSVGRGMIDLRNIAARGTVCAGCHVGNARKEVDHELIASGHPVLTFELDNYSETMPAHWSPHRDTHGVRAWAVGQVVKFRESLTNLSRHARGGEWPEFSDMSCYHCHHALTAGAWRQERGWPDRAGLPSWSPQHWTVLRLIIGRVSPGARDELDPLVAQLARNVSRMNDRDGVADTADRIRRILDPLVARIEAKSWSDADVRSMIGTIAADRAVITSANVHAAEQVLLSLQSLASVLTRRNPRLLKGPLMQSLDALFEEVKNRDAFDAARFGEKLQRVKAAV